MPDFNASMPRDGCDAVIVLGAATRAPGVPGAALLRRIAHGIDTFNAARAAHLVVSGGIVGPPPAEAHLMRDIALDRGVPTERIIVEDRARNTFENALFCGRIVRDNAWSRLIVVTDGFHMRRALHTFWRLGLPATGAPAPRPPGTSRLRWGWRHVTDYGRLAYSAYLFARGAHKPFVEREWGV